MGARVGRIGVWLGLMLLVSVGPVMADPVGVGLLSFDLLPAGTNGGTYGIDVTNETVPGGFSTVVTALSFDNLSLSVDLSTGVTETVALSLDPSGVFTTGAIFAAGDVLTATLTGTFSPTTVTLADGSTVNIDSGFSTVLSDAAGALVDGDFAVINANTVAVQTPEPGSLLLLGISLVVVILWCARNGRRASLAGAGGWR
jgi:PEP-CTERM motif